MSSEPAMRFEEETAATPRRVVIVAPSLDIFGGQAIQADRLLSRLADVESVEASLLPINPRLPGPLRWLQRIKYLRTLVTEVPYLISLFRQLRSADVVHVFSASYFSFILAPAPAVLVARLYGKRTILNYRSGEAEDHLSRWGPTVLPILRMADEVVVGSGYLRDVFAEFDITAGVVPNIVDLNRFDRPDISSGHPVIVANRNFEPNYNVGCVLRAFSLIQRRLPNAELLIAGDGSERNHLEQLAAELGLRNVRFLGQIEPDSMPELLARGDVYLNAPNVDNMPASILEAFAAGIPVVTTSAGGIPYIVEDEENGLLVPLDDHRALAEAALRVLEDPDLASRIVDAGKRQCRSQYSWRHVRERWLEWYATSEGGSKSRTGAAPELRSH